MKKLIITALAVLLCSQGAFAAETHYKLRVDGLVCPFCEYNIEKKLGKLDGVLSVKANLKEGVVSVLIADGKTLAKKIVKQEITDAGFTLKSIEVHEPGKK